MLKPNISVNEVGVSMKNYLLASALFVASVVSAGTVLAADLDPPPPPVNDLRPAHYDWTGLYVGAWAGSACIDGKLTVLSSTPTEDFEVAGCAGKGGILAGYNHQFENFVLGIEGDWGMTGFMSYNDDPGADFHYEFDTIATLRGKAGYAFDDTLLYVTGGLAYAKGDLDGIDNIALPPAP
jgi:outer membrane immunogenic protein